MKILIVNESDIIGGAARAAYRLHVSLLEQKVESQMLVQNKSSDDPTVLTETSRMYKILNRIRPVAENVPTRFYKHRTNTTFSTMYLPFSTIIERINALNSDIVHLHWVCGNMMTIEDLARIKAPIVWSLHDMWAFTGGCHYDEECGQYNVQCGNCKVLGSKKNDDLSRIVFDRKEKAFSQISDLTIVGLSKWLTDCSRKSSLFKNRIHVTLPNPIDTNVSTVMNKVISREILHLPQDKKLVLFGAMNSTGDLRKGFQELSESLRILKGENIELVVFGNKENDQKQMLGFKIHYLGQIHDDEKLVQLYNAADVMIVPSLQENLSNAIMESMSCGTPVVGFDIGGNGDMVDHGQNGYLARPYDVQDLAQGIQWVLDHPHYDELCTRARKKIVENFDSEIVAKKYIALYEDILSLATVHKK